MLSYRVKLVQTNKLDIRLINTEMESVGRGQVQQGDLTKQIEWTQIYKIVSKRRLKFQLKFQKPQTDSGEQRSNWLQQPPVNKLSRCDAFGDF